MTMAVIGSADEVRGFALAGVEAVACGTAAEAAAALDALAQHPRVAVLIVTQAIADALPASIERLQNRVEPPIVIVLDGQSGTRNEG
jgi:vacuolar-type H+-ATPase subunit F/Vma7